MKKTLALFLCAVLMLSLLPAAALSAVAEEGAKIEVPERPTLTSEKVIYQGFNNGNDANDGLTKNTAKKTFGYENGSGISSLLTEGGKVIAVTKCYIGKIQVGGVDTSYTFPAFNGNTVLFTAKDTDGTSYIGNNADSGKGQYGHFMIEPTFNFQVPGNVILREIGLLDRTPTTKEHASNWRVMEGGKLVVEDTVLFRGAANCYAAPGLIVDEGGYAYLDTLGFLTYAGKGTIILNNALVDQIDENTFAEFEGIVADEDGNVLFGTVPVADEHWTAELSRPIITVTTDKKSYDYYNKLTLTITITNPDGISDWWPASLPGWHEPDGWLGGDSFRFEFDGEDGKSSVSGAYTVDSVSDYGMTVTLTDLFSNSDLPACEGELVVEMPLFNNTDTCLYGTAAIAYTGEFVPCEGEHTMGEWQFGFGDDWEEGHERICEICGYKEFVAEECTPADKPVIDEIYDWSGDEPVKTPCWHERTVCTVCGRTIEDIPHHPNERVKEQKEYISVWDEEKEDYVDTSCYMPMTVCEDCGEVLEKGENVHPNGKTVEKTQHFQKWDEAAGEWVDSACTFTDICCAECGEVLEKGEDVHPNGKTTEVKEPIGKLDEETGDFVETACTRMVTYCDDCGQQIEIGEATHTSLTTRTRESVAEEPTCNLIGVKSHATITECTECGELVEVDMTMAFSEPLGHDLKDGVCTRCGKAPAYNATLTADKTSIDDGETLTAVYTLTNPDGTPVAGKKIALAYPLTTEETSAWLYRQEEAVTDENGKVTVEIKLSREDGIEPGKKILLVMDPEEPRSDDVNAWTTFFFGAAESQEPAPTDTQPAPPTGDGSALFLALAGLSLAAAAFLAIKRKERV